MISFITGPINSGKSTRLFNIYKEINTGDGIYNIHRFIKGKYIGQDLITMSNRNITPFSRINSYIPNNWHEKEFFENYSFSYNGINYVEELVLKLIKTNQLIFLDEIGPLELMGGGLNNCFNIILKNKCNAFVVCRDHCINEVIEKFKINEYCIIK